LEEKKNKDDEELTEKIKIIFEEYDKDKSGKLERDEVSKLVKDLLK